METKEDIVGFLKEWIRVDTNIRKQQTILKQMKAEKKAISDNLMKTMKSNEIDSFNTPELMFTFAERVVRNPISKKYLENILLEYFDHDSKKATEIQEFIMSNRKSSVKECLKAKRKLPNAVGEPASG